MTAQALLAAYAAGERNFIGADLGGADLGGAEPPPTPGLRREGSRRDEKANS